MKLVKEVIGKFKDKAKVEIITDFLSLVIFLQLRKLKHICVLQKYSMNTSTFSVSAYTSVHNFIFLFVCMFACLIFPRFRLSFLISNILFYFRNFLTHIFPLVTVSTKSKRFPFDVFAHPHIHTTHFPTIENQKLQ